MKDIGLGLPINLLRLIKNLIFLKKKKVTIDLGAAPGSWSQVLVKNNLNKIIAIDIKDIELIEGVTFIKKDINELIENKKYFDKYSIDLVLSDMAPKSTGHKFTDQTKAAILAEKALTFATKYLIKNGDFVCKLLHGKGEKDMQERAKKNFNIAKFFKPKSSRRDSKEIYLICLGFNNLQ